MVEGFDLSQAGGQAPAVLPLRKRFAGIVASAMGVSVVAQALAFFRQLMIAAFFGVARGMDIYLMAYAVAMMVAFAFGGIFDSIAVPRLVQRRERDGEAASRALAVSVFRLAWILGIAASAVTLIAVPVLAPLIASGFDAAERHELYALAWYFLPWTALCLPYYAAGSRHKSQRHFSRVFSAEIVIVLVSMGALALRHGVIGDLPLAYAAGYAAGLIVLLPGAGLFGRGVGLKGLWPLVRNVGELFLANQTGNLATLANRHYQSLIPAGGIAAVGYATQVVNALAMLVTIRETFVVPLAEQRGRKEKLERLVIGLLLLAVPIAVFVSLFAGEAVTILFQRGRFDANAAAVTAEVLQISALALVPSVVNAPFLRMFQIIDRISLIHVVYVWSAGFVTAFGFLFVGTLGWGARGVAAMLLANGVLTCGVSVYFVARAGLRIAWPRVGAYAAFALAASGLAIAAAFAATALFGDPWARFLCGGTVFVAVTGACYFTVRARLRRILF